MDESVKKLWAEKTFELMNIGAGALLFGQFFSNHKFNIPIAIVGLLFIIAGYLFSYLLLHKRR